MTLSSIKELLQAVDRVRRRRILILHARQIGGSMAVLVTLLMLCGLLALGLPPLRQFSIVLFCILVAAAAVLVWRYVKAARGFDVEDRRLAHYIEEHIPDLEQRMLTSMDAWHQGDLDRPNAPYHSRFVTSLWRDTLDHVRGEDLQRTIGTRPAWLTAGAVLVLIGLLAGSVWYSDRFATAARQVIWPWSAGSGDSAGQAGMAVSPGDILVRRGSDVAIAATVKSARSKRVWLYIDGGDGAWRQLSMQNRDSAKQYYYLLSSVASDMDYFVDSGYDRSRQFRIQVFDLNRVESIDVYYRFPAYTRMENKAEKNTGDIAAPEGTQVRLVVSFNQPVQHALLRFDRGPGIDLAVEGKAATGTFVVTQDDAYTVDALDDAGRQIENPIRYLVRATPDAPPQITVTMPGRDLQVMALEEVRVAVAATDDFGITRLGLTYNVGGAIERHVDLLHAAGQMEGATFAEGKSLIHLEDLKVTPGDILSYFVTAADNNGLNGPTEAISDIYFLEVISTDEAFRRASGMSGGGAGGMGPGGAQGRPPSALVENQKSIIAATWKLLMRQRGIPGETFEQDVGVVAGSQQNLAQRTQMSLSRLNERFSFSDESYDRSVVHMREAVSYMQTAAAKLSTLNLAEALGPEQAALQAILKAESQSRQTAIQMARNSGGAGGYGESQRERDDLRELFEMEMGRLENRYEMPRTDDNGGNAEQDDMLKRLRELAQRQERLNRSQLDAQRRKDRMTEDQKRRRLAELQREQEALRREAEALSQRWSQQAASRQTRSSLTALDQAVERMREAARNLEQGGNPGSAAAGGREALQLLQEQEKRMRRRSAGVEELVTALGEKAAQLQAQESDIVRQVDGAKSAADKEMETTFRQRISDLQNNLSEIAAKKDDLKHTLSETEELIRATGAKGNTSHPAIARQAGEVLRGLLSESLSKQIDESKADLQPDRLQLAMEKEKAIEQSIARLNTRLQGFDALMSKSGEERIRRAADTADALVRELENLSRMVETLRMQQRRLALTPAKGEAQPGDGGLNQGRDFNQIRDGLERSRRYARGLLQPWAEGERWAVDARSIQRQLTTAQIEDFMNQPALWQKLMDPVREVASALRGQLEAKQLNAEAFSPSEPAPPSPYESLVERYYRSLSEPEAKKHD